MIEPILPDTAGMTDRYSAWRERGSRGGTRRAQAISHLQVP